MRSIKPMFKTLTLSLTALSLVLALTAGARAQSKMDKKDKAGKMDKKEASLYQRLGGKKAITVVVDDFVTNVAGDGRINSFFSQTAADPKRLDHFKKMLVGQICQATGGPCKYTGKDMKTAHKGMNITDAHFNALVEDLTKALDKNKVGEKEKGELLGALAAMKGDIVGH